MTDRNLVWHEAAITKEERQNQHRHGSCVLWFTGLSGSGKSTLANAVDSALFHRSAASYVLDGDNIRHGLNQDLGFSDEDRVENIRRIGEVAKLFVDSGTILSTAFISPFRADRDAVRNRFAGGDFIEIHVDCSLNTCEGRDVKGLYKKARNGEIPHFTGISSPYEAPNTAELVVNTEESSVEEGVQQVINYLRNKNILRD